MAQLWTALAALAEDLRLLPRAHTGFPTNATQLLGIWCPLLAPQAPAPTHTDTHTHKHLKDASWKELSKVDKGHMGRLCEFSKMALKINPVRRRQRYSCMVLNWDLRGHFLNFGCTGTQSCLGFWVFLFVFFFMANCNLLHLDYF